MPKIKQLYAWVIANKDEDDEGVPATKLGDMVMPLIGSDLRRAESLRPLAQQAANEKGKSIKLIKSTGIETVEVLEPRR